LQSRRPRLQEASRLTVLFLRWHNLCCSNDVVNRGDGEKGVYKMSQLVPRSTAANVRSSSLWTAARGAQIISCELIVPRRGPAVVRCAYGPESIIRSQFVVSDEAAAAVAETWKVALVAQGFRIVPPKAAGN
jgi:hypothetical protein